MLSLIAALALTGASAPASLHDFTVPNIDGNEVKLSKFKGQVVLVVNVASRCGLTPQYEALEALYRKEKARGFTVLGFPANNFGNQEPGSNEEIKEFCSAKFNVSFPMFSKISVKGEDIHPLYKWLLAQTDNPNDIEWNFAKFLVGRDGKVIARFAPGAKPDSVEVTKAVEAALAKS